MKMSEDTEFNNLLQDAVEYTDTAKRLGMSLPDLCHFWMMYNRCKNTSAETIQENSKMKDPQFKSMMGTLAKRWNISPETIRNADEMSAMMCRAGTALTPDDIRDALHSRLALLRKMSPQDNDLADMIEEYLTNASSSEKSSECSSDAKYANPLPLRIKDLGTYIGGHLAKYGEDSSDRSVAKITYTIELGDCDRTDYEGTICGCGDSNSYFSPKYVVRPELTEDMSKKFSSEVKDLCKCLQTVLDSENVPDELLAISSAAIIKDFCERNAIGIISNT